MALPHLMLIAGIPAAGKSHFGDWLQAHHGYLHIDDVSGNRLRLHGLHQAWEDALLLGDARPFVAELQRREQPAVLNWGFPLDSLPFVGLLKHAGLSLWWFEADLGRARREHVALGKDGAAFDTQVADIAADRVQIEILFRPHMLNVLSARGERMPPEAIAEAMSKAA